VTCLINCNNKKNLFIFIKLHTYTQKVSSTLTRLQLGYPWA